MQIIENVTQEKSFDCSQLTPDHIEQNILSEHYFTATDGVYGAFMRSGVEHGLGWPTSLDFVTFCVLELRNGFTVTGHSTCASWEVPENFNAERAMRIARQSAADKIIALMEYERRSNLLYAGLCKKG